LISINSRLTGWHLPSSAAGWQAGTDHLQEQAGTDHQQQDNRLALIIVSRNLTCLH
jgi:hypothetical protein